MQLATTAGLVSAPHTAQRFAVKCIHNAPVGLAASLIEEWSRCTASVAHAKLSQPDVSVTNQSDKELQLPKVLELDRKVRGLSGLVTRRDSGLGASCKMRSGRSEKEGGQQAPDIHGEWRARALEAEARVAELERQLLGAANRFHASVGGHAPSVALSNEANAPQGSKAVRGRLSAQVSSVDVATWSQRSFRFGSRRVWLGIFVEAADKGSSTRHKPGVSRPGSSQSDGRHGEMAPSVIQQMSGPL